MMMPLITVSTVVVVVVVVERQRKKERDREKETNNHYKLWVRLNFGIRTPDRNGQRGEG